MSGDNDIDKLDAFIDVMDNFTIWVEALRAAAEAHDRDESAFAERVSETGTYRSAAFREESDDGWVVEVESDGDPVDQFTFPDEMVGDAIAEHGDILGLRNEVQLGLASDLDAISSDLRDGTSVDEALNRLVSTLRTVPGVSVTGGLGTQGRVSFGSPLEDVDGSAVFIPEDREAAERVARDAVTDKVSE